MKNFIKNHPIISILSICATVKLLVIILYYSILAIYANPKIVIPISTMALVATCAVYVPICFRKKIRKLEEEAELFPSWMSDRKTNQVPKKHVATGHLPRQPPLRKLDLDTIIK